MAVPSFSTTTPAASDASETACAIVAPTDIASVSAEITVSPAPLTSYTWRATAGTVNGFAFFEKSVMPCSPRVMST